MPESESCMVVLIRAARLEASASTAIIRSGFTLFATPNTISIVSTPVTPNTPGAIAHTLGISKSNASGMCSLICLVTKTRSATRGPRESGVTPRLPRPTTSTVPLLSFVSGSGINSVSSRRRHCDTCANKSSGRCVRASASSVMYLPCALPSFCAAVSLNISMRLIFISPSFVSSSRMPSMSGLSSRISAARSVYLPILPPI